MTKELAILCQEVLAWLPSIQSRQATSGQLLNYCKRLYEQLARLRQHHEQAWDAFALAAGRNGFPLWNGEPMESAHQALAMIARQLFVLLGGEWVARSQSPSAAPTQFLRLETQMQRMLANFLPGFDIAKPALPPGIFQALAWELRVSENPSEAEPLPASSHSSILQLPKTQQELLDKFLSLNANGPVSGKEILGREPNDYERKQLAILAGKPKLLAKAGHHGYVRGPRIDEYLMNRTQQVGTGRPE